MSEQAPGSYSDFKDRLDEIVEAVSDEDISLDDALALYEEAVKVGLKLSDRLEADISEQEAADASDMPEGPDGEAGEIGELPVGADYETALASELPAETDNENALASEMPAEPDGEAPEASEMPAEADSEARYEELK